MRLYWQRHLDNFGDRLAPIVVEHLSGKPATFEDRLQKQRHLFAIGSMLGSATRQTIVWGTGILTWQCQPAPEARLHMVRGPLSYSAARAAGAKCPPLWGDPAAFVREIFPASTEKYNEWCLVPHFRERPIPPIDGVQILHPTGDPAEFCRALSSSCYVLSSSLHGLIAAHAYGLKAAWIKLSSHPKGDDTKFRDYLLSQSLNPEPLRLESLDWASISRTQPHLTEAEFDLQAMRGAFPHR